jgi:hypothetical protein
MGMRDAALHWRSLFCCQGFILAPGLILTDSPKGIRRALAMPSYCEAIATGSA